MCLWASYLISASISLSVKLLKKIKLVTVPPHWVDGMIELVNMWVWAVMANASGQLPKPETRTTRMPPLPYAIDDHVLFF